MPKDALEHVPAVMETRLAHEVHRVATTLLAEAAAQPSVPLSALGRLRDFLVAILRHHHETEDNDLWPRIAANAPEAARALGLLSEEHERLEGALDQLSAVDLQDNDVLASSGPADRTGPSGDMAEDRVRAALRKAAVEVRDTVHDHLAHEEPLLFPALRDHISRAEWQAFAQRVIATTPPVEGHLMVGFLDEVGTPAEVDMVLAGLPEQLRALLPAVRLQAREDLKILRGASN
ncbi:hemerythrin domain-containing protein [Streptomyces sp. NPDC089424]|uniref:hemerythrin domain-containing protein n=1 Tax=Streptomyces sp. NPDC089424 TaxID=3365917 RepID=UPI0038069EB2